MSLFARVGKHIGVGDITLPYTETHLTLQKTSVHTSTELGNTIAIRHA